MLALLREVTEIILYLIKTFSEGFFTHFNQMRVSPERKLYVLANGPSLNIFLENYPKDKNIDSSTDFIAINDFVNDKKFLDLKPKYYVVSDPMFLFDTKFRERGLKVIKGLKEKVNWDLILFIRYDARKSPFLPLLNDNKFIKIEYYHSYYYPLFNGLTKIRRFIYKKGWGNGEYSTVVLNAIYIGITLGYKKMYLEGVDHTFFNGLMVTENNIPCYVIKHSFDTSEEIKPMTWYYDDSREYKDMPYFLLEMYHIFKGHWIMADYAKSVGAKIYNCTEGSLIDAYPRLKK